MSGVHCYVTAAAVRDFCRIIGVDGCDERQFSRAAVRLQELALNATRKGEAPHTEYWQAKALVRGRVERLELVISTRSRPEGPLPQLVRVQKRSRGGK